MPRVLLWEYGFSVREKVMVRKLFHGSQSIIKAPVWGQGKRYNDYGLGFYCTDSLEMAKEWGVGKGRNGFANCYEINCEGLPSLI